MSSQVVKDPEHLLVDILVEVLVMVFPAVDKGLDKVVRVLPTVTQVTIKDRREDSQAEDKDPPASPVAVRDLRAFPVELKDLRPDSQVVDKDLLLDSPVEDKDRRVVKVQLPDFRAVDKVLLVDSLVKGKAHQGDSLVEDKDLLLDFQVEQEQVQVAAQVAKALRVEMVTMVLLMAIILLYQVNQEKIIQFYPRFRKLVSVVMHNNSQAITLMLKHNVKYSTFVQIIKLMISCVQMVRYSINSISCACGGISSIVVQRLVYFT